MEEFKEMPMTAKEAVRAMEWARANGHTEKEAIDLVEYITGQTPPNENDEKREERKK